MSLSSDDEDRDEGVEDLINKLFYWGGISPVSKYREYPVLRNSVFDEEEYDEESSLLSYERYFRVDFDGTKPFYVDYPFTYRMVVEFGKRGNWVIDAFGNIYMVPTRLNPNIDSDEAELFSRYPHHSFILQGADVACAGEFVLSSRGNVKSFNNKSGHYEPSEVCLNDALEEELMVRGVNTDKIQFKPYKFVF